MKTEPSGRIQDETQRNFLGGAMAKVFIFNGPNLNLLGQREPQIYGRDTLADVEQSCRRLAEVLGLEVEFRQTNAEGEMLGWIHDAREGAAGIIINPGGWSHTSVALRDALSACSCPILEVHISNIHRREPFRHHSYVSGVATGVICGFGTHGYELALHHMAHLLKRS